MEEYLSRVIDKKLPINHQIINQLQDIFNLMPNLTVESMVKSFSVKTNDMMLVIYLSSMIRSVIALHNLINNKIQNKEIETQAAQQAKERQRDKEEVEELKKKVQAEKDAKNAAQDANGKD
jgi:26S proteasome regulatory subunit N8